MCFFFSQILSNFSGSSVTQKNQYVDFRNHLIDLITKWPISSKNDVQLQGSVLQQLTQGLNQLSRHTTVFVSLLLMKILIKSVVVFSVDFGIEPMFTTIIDISCISF